MSVRANFADICLQGMPERSMRSGTELAREIQLTDWSTTGNLSNRSSGVQIPRDICTRFGRYLYSTKYSWIIKEHIYKKRRDSRSSSASSEKKNVIWKSTMIGDSYQVVSNVQ